MPEAPSVASPVKADPVADLMSPATIASLFPEQVLVDTNKEAVAETTKEQGKAALASEGKDGESKAESGQSETTKPATSSTSAPAVDLSGLPGVLQEAIKSLPAEKQAGAAKEAREGYLRHGDYTRKTQDLAKAEKDAEAWRAAMSKPALVRAWQKAMSEDGDEPKATAAADTSKDDEEAFAKLIAEGTPKDWAAYQKKRDDAVRAQARKDFEALYEEKAVAPVRRFKTVEAALQTHADENGIDYDAMREAVKAAAQYPSNGPIESWDPAKAVDLITPFLNRNGTPKNGATTSKSNGAAPQTPPIPKVAPPGRGSAAAAPSPLPAHRREGRQPRSDQEQAEELAYLLTEQLGKPISVADLDAINH